MPTYEYECTTNGHRFEVKQSFSEDALTTCVECGEPVRKVFSAAGIVFKGSGYYVTDSRKAAGSSGGSDKAPASTSSNSADGGSASKAASSTSSSGKSSSSASSSD